jgi:thiamine kinase
MTFDAAAVLTSMGLLTQQGEPVRCTVLAGGFWNDVVRVKTARDDLVVKHFGPRSADWTLFPIVPEVEARALEVLAGTGLAPEPLGFRPAEAERGAVLVYRFVSGRPLQNEVEDAARAIAAVHRQRAEDFRLMPVTPEEILADADRLPRPPADEPLWRRLLALRPEPVAHAAPAERVLIHGDFGSGNMIVGKKASVIIDWQCPGLGDGAEDLWSFLSPAFQAVYGGQAWDAEAIARFRAAYGDDAVLARLDVLAPFFAYRYAHYCIFRIHQLEAGSPAQERYRQAALAGLGDLEARQSSTRS